MTDTQTTTPPTQGTQASFPPGQHLRCDQCGSEIQIIQPCTCQPPDQVLKCCGKEMNPVS